MIGSRPPLDQLLDSRVRTSLYPDIEWVTSYVGGGSVMGEPLLLAMGESWLGPDPELTALLSKAPHWTHGYQLALAGAPTTRHRLSDLVRQQHQLSSDETTVALVHGGTKSAMCQIAWSAVSRSTSAGRRSEPPHLITLAPGWEYHDALSPAGFTYESIILDPIDGFAVPVGLICERVRAAAGRNSPVVVAINPHQNPCGSVWNAFSVRRVAEEAAAMGAWLLIDDAYFGLAANEDQSAVLSAARIAEEVLGDSGRWFCVRSFGKQLQTSGWGAGVAIGPHDLIDYWVHRVRACYSYGISAMTHWAISEYLGTPGEIRWTSEMIDRISANRSTLVSALSGMGLDPRAGAHVPYVLFSAPEGSTSAQDYCARLAQSTGVVLTPSTSGAVLPPLVRFYVGSSTAEVREAIRRMREFQ